MRPLVLLPFYIHWHYSQALKNIVSITRNLLWFFWHFFSVGVLVRTLFAPWQKIHEERSSNEISAILSTLTINTLMRTAGALIRLFMIVMGLLTMAATLVGAAAFFILWLVFPLCIVFVLLTGVVIFFKHS